MMCDPRSLRSKAAGGRSYAISNWSKHALPPVLPPPPIHQSDNRLIHYQRRWISLLPRGVDTHNPAIHRTRPHKHLLRKNHVPRRIEAGENPPLNVFVIVEPNIRTDSYHKTNTQRRLHQIFQNFARLLSYADNKQAALDQPVIFDTAVERNRVYNQRRILFHNQVAGSINHKFASDVHLK